MRDLPDGCRPFDRCELLKCATCGKGMAHDGEIAFYEVQIGQVILDYKAIRQIAGLEMMMGAQAAPLAAVFAPTSQVGVRMPTTRVLLCGSCFIDPARCASLPSLWEKSEEHSEPAGEDAS